MVHGEPGMLVQAGRLLGPPCQDFPEEYALQKVWKVVRSEEHTSELQSRRELVCRLLLEKKKRVSTQGFNQSCLDELMDIPRNEQTAWLSAVASGARGRQSMWQLGRCIPQKYRIRNYSTI